MYNQLVLAPSHTGLRRVSCNIAAGNATGAWPHHRDGAHALAMAIFRSFSLRNDEVSVSTPVKGNLHACDLTVPLYLPAGCLEALKRLAIENR